MSPAAHQVCPLCVNDELSVTKIGPGVWRMECPPHGSHPDGAAYAWETTDATEDELEEFAGITAELGLYDDLPRCLVKGEPWVEYGIVEHRYKEMKPDVYAKLIDRYSHTAFGPKSYTASAFIAAALGRLDDHGDVLFRGGLPATGYWSYNGGISYWALPPGPDGDGTLSWAEFATSKGLDPDEWIIGDSP